jgi:hypothetical protein
MMRRQVLRRPFDRSAFAARKSVAFDRLTRGQVLSHIEGMPQGRKGLVCPILQFELSPPLA